MLNAIYYILIVVLILFSAFFSGTEIAYLSVNQMRLRKKADDGSRVAKLAIKIYDNFSDALIAILVGNNFVNIAASAVSTVIALHLAKNNSYGVFIATAIITVLIIVFGEIVPKVLCKNNSEFATCFVAYPLSFFIIIFSPITFILSKLLRACEKIWGVSETTVTEDEMVTLIETAEEDGGIDEEKSELLQNVIEFTDVTLEEIITHRTDVFALDDEDSFEENLRKINFSRYSRLPVYKDSIDNIIGILNINQYYKKLLDDSSADIKNVMLEPTVMHSTTKLPQALEYMRENQLQMVVVLDEYGGTLGIVTMEDVLEQIVGEIWDESDEIVLDIVDNEDGTYKILGDANVYDMFDELDIDDRDFESDCNTVGGWCVEMLEQNPMVGMEFEYKNLHIKITKVDDACVESVLATVSEIIEDEDNDKI